MILISAIMATECCVLHVPNEARAAAAAFRIPTASATDQCGRETPAIEKNQALFAADKACCHFCYDLLAKAVRFWHAANIDEPNIRRGGDWTAIQTQIAKAAATGVVIGLKGRCCGAEHDRNMVLPARKNRQVTRRITQAFLLLERAVLFLVDDNQTKARQRGENCEASPDYDFCLASTRGEPIPTPLSLGKIAMQSDQSQPGKTLTKPFFELWRQVYLRYQQQRLQAAMGNLFNKSEINLGLSTAS